MGVLNILRHGARAFLPRIPGLDDDEELYGPRTPPFVPGDFTGGPFGDVGIPPNTTQQTYESEIASRARGEAGSEPRIQDYLTTDGGLGLYDRPKSPSVAVSGEISGRTEHLDPLAGQDDIAAPYRSEPPPMRNPLMTDRLERFEEEADRYREVLDQAEPGREKIPIWRQVLGYASQAMPFINQTDLPRRMVYGNQRPMEERDRELGIAGQRYTVAKDLASQAAEYEQHAVSQYGHDAKNLATLQKAQAAQMKSAQEADKIQSAESNRISQQKVAILQKNGLPLQPSQAIPEGYIEFSLPDGSRWALPTANPDAKRPSMDSVQAGVLAGELQQLPAEQQAAHIARRRKDWGLDRPSSVVQLTPGQQEVPHRDYNAAIQRANDAFGASTIGVNDPQLLLQATQLWQQDVQTSYQQYSASLARQGQAPPPSPPAFPSSLTQKQLQAIEGLDKSFIEKALGFFMGGSDQDLTPAEVLPQPPIPRNQYLPPSVQPPAPPPAPELPGAAADDELEEERRRIREKLYQQ